MVTRTELLTPIGSGQGTGPVNLGPSTLISRLCLSDGAGVLFSKHASVMGLVFEKAGNASVMGPVS